MRNDKPICMIMVGLPYSGKSTWIRENLSGIPIVSSDKFIEDQAEVQGKTYSEVFSDSIDNAIAAMNALKKIILDKRRSFVHDQTNLTAKKRKNLIRDLDGYHVIAVCFDIPEELHRERIASRPDKYVPDHVMESMRKTFEIPTLEEGFDEIIMVKE